ncbi:DUF5956 family protein [Nocardiopsis sp. LOL_012]|uniref:DUF5956 family protein n=1 Tax=Nocardiopsis sp. LOL_012 TaxID=3345409 RepID=UPI003A848F07
MSKESWSAYMIVEAPPEEACEVSASDHRRFAEVPVSGWHALVLWAIGPAHVIRCLDQRVPEPIRVVCETDGQRSVRVEERTCGDRSAVESEIHEYLMNARVPSQPCGYRWFVEIPSGMNDCDDLLDRFSSSLSEYRGQLMPVEERKVMVTVADLLYRDVKKSESDR